MAAGQQQPLVGLAAEAAGAEHGADAALLIVVDEPGGQPQALNAVPAGAPERNERVEADSHVTGRIRAAAASTSVRRSRRSGGRNTAR